ncbi:MAG: glycosyltransferase family 4 protein [Mucilaginibacter sp.]
MKVLWFSLSPGLADAYLNNNYEGIGWVKSLERNIQDKVELSVAFYHHADIAPFTYGATHYYPVKQYRRGKLTKIFRRLANGIEPDSDIKEFLKIINDVKPDLIHIHGTEGPFGLIQKYVDIPTVISIQGTITVYRYKFFSKITYTDVLRYSYLKSFLLSRSFLNVYKVFAKVAKREQEIYSYSKNFIGRTAWDRRVTKILAPEAKYYHNDEILRDAFYKNECEYRKTHRLIIFTTTWLNIYKGFETVLDCANLLDANNLDYEWQIAGLTPNDEVVRIAAKNTKRPISKNIKFMGMLNQESLAQAMLKAGIYVMASHIENSPNSLCEAQMLGLPCIATNAGGTSSLLEDGKEGILIQDGDPFAMAGAILEMNENYDQAITYGKNARQKARLRHDQEKITDDLLKIYNAVLKKQLN